jgi:hypothetical protein
MPVSVDKEWAESLIGLRMQVEESWWDGCSGSTLYPGRIAAVNFDDAVGRFFLLQLDEEREGETYPMRYDAVLHYADEQHPNFSRFHLPDGLLEDPADEEITLAQLQKRKKRSTTNQRRRELDEQFLNAEEHAEDVSFTVEHAEEESDSEDEEPQKSTNELSQKIGCESVSNQDHMLSSQWHSQATMSTSLPISVTSY